MTHSFLRQFLPVFRETNANQAAIFEIFIPVHEFLLAKFINKAGGLRQLNAEIIRKIAHGYVFIVTDKHKCLDLQYT